MVLNDIRNGQLKANTNFIEFTEIYKLCLRLHGSTLFNWKIFRQGAWLRFVQMCPFSSRWAESAMARPWSRLCSGARRLARTRAGSAPFARPRRRRSEPVVIAAYPGREIRSPVEVKAMTNSHNMFFLGVIITAKVLLCLEITQTSFVQVYAFSMFTKSL